VLAAFAIWAAGATAASPGVDKSYGEGGVVRLGGQVPAGLRPSENEVGPMLPQPDGGVLYATPTQTCVHIWEDPCETFYSVVRYGPDGQVDSTYGQGGFLTFSATQIATRGITVDRAGRLLVVTQTAGGVGGFTVTRYTADGRLDPTFGTDGTAQVISPPGNPYGFGALVAGPDGKLTFLYQSEARWVGGGSEAWKVTLVRLLPNGRPDLGYGKSGRLTFAMAGFIMQAVATPGNGVLILGSKCCGGGDFNPVYRVGAAGRLDTRFDARARRQEAKFISPLGLGRVGALVSRPDGRVDLLGGYDLGTSGGSAGFDLRLSRDGSADAGFGERGISMLAHELVSGIAGAGGSTMALYETFPPELAEEGGQTYLERLRSDGLPDPGFGGETGLPLPAVGRDGTVLGSSKLGISIQISGYRYCREVCPPKPFLTRMIEPPAPKKPKKPKKQHPSRKQHGKGNHR
jgi:uncharacterized delta-60 repeat protein